MLFEAFFSQQTSEILCKNVFLAFTSFFSLFYSIKPFTHVHTLHTRFNAVSTRTYKKMKRSDGPTDADSDETRRRARSLRATSSRARERTSERASSASEVRAERPFFSSRSRDASRRRRTTDDGRRVEWMSRASFPRARARGWMTFGCGNDARGRLAARERLGAGDARWESLVDVLLAVLSRRRRRRSVRTARATTTPAGALRRRREIASASPARPTDRGTVSR